MSDLKPCPFCGGHGITAQSPVLGRAWRVSCTSCFAASPPCLAEEGAIETWNRRTADKALQNADASRIDGGRFQAWTLMDFAAECRAQSRDQLDPDFSSFMGELAKRLTAINTGGTVQSGGDHGR